jgi:hypothetical protein
VLLCELPIKHVGVQSYIRELLGLITGNCGFTQFLQAVTVTAVSYGLLSKFLRFNMKGPGEESIESIFIYFAF